MRCSHDLNLVQGLSATIGSKTLIENKFFINCEAKMVLGLSYRMISYVVFEGKSLSYKISM